MEGEKNDKKIKEFLRQKMTQIFISDPLEYIVSVKIPN